MSGIFAYIGDRECGEILVSGISKLFSRGDDMTGFVIQSENEFITCKGKEPIEELSKKIKSNNNSGTVGIAECSDAVRVKASTFSAAPSVFRSYAVCMDGSITNFDILKRWTNASHTILTDEDLLAVLLEIVSNEDKIAMIKKLVPSLGGNPSYLFVSTGEEAIYCKSGITPLIIGVGEDGYYIASEVNALPPDIIKYYPLDHNESAKVTKERCLLYDDKFKRIKKSLVTRDADDRMTDGLSPDDGTSYAALCVKETLSRFVRRSKLDFTQFHFSKKTTDKIKKIVLVGEGSSLAAAQSGACYLRSICDLPAVAFNAGELRYSGETLDKNTLLIALSDRGEEADLLECVRRAKIFSAKTISFTNQKNTSLARNSTFSVTLNASYRPFGGFLSLYLALSFFLLTLGYQNETVSEVQLNVTVRLAEMLTGKIASSVKPKPILEGTAARLINSDPVFVTGIGADAALSSEAARILRQQTGMNASAYSAFDLSKEEKHLLKGSFILAIITDKDLMQEALIPLRRIRSLGAEITLITAESIEAEIDDFECIITFPDSAPLFHPLTCIAEMHQIAQFAKTMLDDENARQII